MKVLRTQRLICGGTNAQRCKMFAGMLVGTTLDWFSSLPEKSQTSFEVFSSLFISHFSENKVKPLEVANLFKVKQAKKESIKQFLCRFSEEMVQIPQSNKRLFVEAFIRGLRSGSFEESLIERRSDNMAAVKIYVLNL